MSTAPVFNVNLIVCTNLRVLATARVLVGMANAWPRKVSTTLAGSLMPPQLQRELRLTRVEDLDADLVGLRGSDVDVLELEGLACAPADGGLAPDDFAGGVGHDGL